MSRKKGYFLSQNYIYLKKNNFIFVIAIASISEHGGMGACPHDKIIKRSSVFEKRGAVSYGIRQKFAARRSALGGFGGRSAPITLSL